MKNEPASTLESTIEGEVPLRPRRKGIYVLPNMITLAALFGGFYAIVMAMNGRFEHAVIGVFCALVLDSLDGRVARMTHTQRLRRADGQPVGHGQLRRRAGADRLRMALKGMGKLGWVAAFVYCASAALRLARFNTNIGVVDKRWFQGLPSPAAAALVTGFIWVMDDAGFKQVGRIDWLAWGAMAVTLYAGLTMVTNVPFYSFKDLGQRRSVPFIVLVLIALAIAAVNLHPPLVLFGAFVFMACRATRSTRGARPGQAGERHISTDEPDERGLH